MSVVPSEPENPAQLATGSPAAGNWRCLTSAGTARLRQAAGSSYLRGIATLSGGQMLAAIVPFLAAPILGRIYRPEDYALLATYGAVVNVAAAIATLHYQHGVLVERTTQRAHQMAWISIAATMTVAAMMIPVAVGIYFLDPFAASVRGHRLWFLVLPLSTLVSGMSLAAMAVANRAQSYKTLAVMQFTAAAASAMASIAFGLLHLQSDGLMLAYAVSQIVTLGFSASILVRHRVFAAVSSRRRLGWLAVRHRGYPLFTLPAAVIHSLSAQLPVFVLTAMGASATLGAFSRAQGLLFLPVIMFSGAVGRVYIQRAAADFNRTGSCRPVFLKTTPLIMLYAAPFLVSFTLFGETIFTLYLGENWREAGQIAQIICPILFLQMFASPLGSSIVFAGNQHVGMYVHIVGILLASLGCLAPILYSEHPHHVLRGWALGMCALNVLQLALGWKLSKAPNQEASIRSKF